MTEAELLARLHARVAAGNLYAEQVRYRGRTADAVWFDATTMDWHFVEAKTSRADWLRELAQPEKSRPFRQQVDYAWLLAPADVPRYDEMPERWGLLVPGVSRLYSPRSAVRHPSYGKTDREFLAAVVRAAVETGRRYAAVINQTEILSDVRVTLDGQGPDTGGAGPDAARPARDTLPPSRLPL